MPALENAQPAEAGRQTEYGTTWWGRRWLDALAGIDYENRIPRGKAYADQGRVLSFKADPKKRLVKARVEGNYDPFYLVRLKFEAIAPRKLKKLIDEMAASPLIVSRLAARELSPEIAEICDRLDIRIFPQSWKDIDMQCSCPDEAVPCKHIAAVIYKMCEEIDANPFILFQLHGIDLIGQMQKRGVEIDRAVDVELPRWKDLVAETGVPAPEDDEQWLAALSAVTFEKPAAQGEALAKLFADKPAGYTRGSLRELLVRVLERASRLAARQKSLKAERTLPEYDESKPLLSVNGWGQTLPDASLVWRERSAEGELQVLQAGKPGFSALRFARGFDSRRRPLFEMFSGFLTARDFAEAPKALEALFDAWLVASRLVESGAVLAQAYEPVEDFIAVRWMPAVLDAGVRSITERVGEAFAHVDRDFLRISGTRSPVHPLLLGELVLGVFIESYVHEAFAEEMALAGEEPEAQDERSIIFAGATVDRSEDAEIEALAMRVESWLSPLVMEAALPVKPIVVVYDCAAAGGADDIKDAPVSLELRFALKDKEKAPESVALFDILEEDDYKDVRFDCLRSVSQLSSHCPALTELLRNKTSRRQVTLEQLTDLLFESLPALRLLGVDIVLPRSLKSLLQPQARMQIDSEDEWKLGSGLGGLASLLNFRWQLAVGDTPVSEEEFDRLCEHAGKVVRFRDGFMYVSADEVKRIRHRLQRRSFTKSELLREALGSKKGGKGVVLGKKLRAALDQIFADRDIAMPAHVEAVLRPYQERGYRWMMRNFYSGVGSIIADDMGLGKTLQVITVLERLREDGALDEKQALVVVPASLLINWQREVGRFAPKLRLGIFYGPNRELDESVHIILTTYGTLRSSIKVLGARSWRLLVIDEAQAVKNYRTSAFRAVTGVAADGVIAMSGTPVENRLSEYWSIMEVCNKGLFGTIGAFRDEFVVPIEINRDPAAAEAFRRISSPFLLRRMKTDKSIISDLPDKVVSDEFCTLTKEQASLYEAEVNRGLALVEGASSNFVARALVLQLMVRLKQICDAPALYDAAAGCDSPATSGKMQRLFDILDEMHEAGRKVLIFTQFVQMGLLLQGWIEEHTGRRPQFLHGGLNVRARQQLVDRFQKRRDENVMILSLRAAGTGLNLTAASAVVHYDLWWNPAVENQATDRAYRIGQKQNVSVYRFVTANTYEEKINELIASKKELVDMTVAAGENWIGDLNRTEIASIFRLSAR